MTSADRNRLTAMRAMVVTKPIAPALPELTAAQELALLCRCLFAEGYDDHLAGHITYKQPDGTFLVNPFGLTWDEVTASDIMTMDADGNEISGRWTITDAGSKNGTFPARSNSMREARSEFPSSKGICNWRCPRLRTTWACWEDFMSMPGGGLCRTTTFMGSSL